MKNIDVAHRFFYDRGGSFERSYMNVSYDNDTFYSYSTAVAKITINRQGQTVCLMGANWYSRTSSRHVHYLYEACPYPIIEVYQPCYARSFNISEIITHVIDDLAFYGKQKLTLKNNRERLIYYYDMLRNIATLNIDDDNNDRITDALNQYKSIYNTINSPEAVQQLKKEQRQKIQKRLKNLKKELKNILDKYSYLELIHYAYDGQLNYTSYRDTLLNKKLKEKLREYLNPARKYSFIWRNGSTCYTSQGIQVEWKKVEPMLIKWHNNELRQGMTIDKYTVLDVKPSTIKVGCHLIPAENLKELYKYYINKTATFTPIVIKEAA